MHNGEDFGSGLVSNERIEGMEVLIKTIDSVQDVMVKTRGDPGAATEIEFPQIVTIGGQSSGKSSVLENLVGQSFFPRGTGMVTRCPIVMRLVNTPGDDIWCELEHKPNERFRDFNCVERELFERMVKIAGTTRGITNESIRLTFYSPRVLNLTVVDLPGIVQIPVGDQPPDISQRIKDLVRSYISQENSIILVVSSGNVDIANSEAIKFAEEVDPGRKRTILVVTKLDLAEDTAKMTEILKGEAVHIHLGIVGVINRSQMDINRNTPLSAVLEFEETFLQTKYSSIAHKHGIRFLAKMLNHILSVHIAKSCRGLVERVRDLARNSKAELETLGNEGDLSDDNKRQIMTSSIHNFSRVYRTQVDGQQRREIMDSTLIKGARLNSILTERLLADLNSIDSFENLTNDRILRCIKNGMPVGARMAIPEVALNHFVQEEVKRMLPVSLQIVKLVFEEMVEMISNCLGENLRFPQLNVAITSVVKELLTEKSTITKDFLSTYFEVQSTSALTANPAFNEIFKRSMTPISVVDLGTLPDRFVWPQAQQRNAGSEEDPNDFTEPQLTLCREIKSLAAVLFEITRWQVQDFIAKAILTTLIYKTVDDVPTRLGMELNIFEKIESLVKEPENVRSRRLFLQQKIEEYNEALRLLEDLIDRAN